MKPLKIKLTGELAHRAEKYLFKEAEIERTQTNMQTIDAGITSEQPYIAKDEQVPIPPSLTQNSIYNPRPNTHPLKLRGNKLVPTPAKQSKGSSMKVPTQRTIMGAQQAPQKPPREFSQEKLAMDKALALFEKIAMCGKPHKKYVQSTAKKAAATPKQVAKKNKYYEAMRSKKA